MRSPKQQVISFGPAQNLVGVLSFAEPSDLRDRPTLVLLNAGMVHKVGPSGLYAQLARTVADAGFPVFRFDFSGVGDSSNQAQDADFETTSLREVRAAFDFLEQRLEAKSFCVAGLCMGADVALRTCSQDDRAIAAILINGFFLAGTDLETILPRASDRTRRRYYRRSASNPRKWMRLLAGKSDLRTAIRAILHWQRGASTSPRIQTPCVNRSASHGADWSRALASSKMSLIFSEGSTALDIYELHWRRQLEGSISTGTLGFHFIPDADHTFTSVQSRLELTAHVLAELRRCTS